MNPPPDYKTRLKQKIVLTDHVRDFVFELEDPDMMTFEAGQFVLIKATHPETGEFLSRAYSIASPPQETHQLRLNIEIVKEGKLSPFIDTWEEGQEVILQGPFGHFTMKSSHEKALVFIATGVGIAPIRSMIEDLLNTGDSRKMHLYFGLRSQDHLFYQDVFEKLAADHENFTFTLTLSQPKPGWDGSEGRVTAILPDVEFDSTNTDFYLCGGKPMIDDVKKILLEKQIPEEQIFFEQFFV